MMIEDKTKDTITEGTTEEEGPERIEVLDKKEALDKIELPDKTELLEKIEDLEKIEAPGKIEAQDRTEGRDKTEDLGKIEMIGQDKSTEMRDPEMSTEEVPENMTETLIEDKMIIKEPLEEKIITTDMRLSATSRETTEPQTLNGAKSRKSVPETTESVLSPRFCPKKL